MLENGDNILMILKRPNLPDSDVKMVIIDGRADQAIISRLASMGICTVPTLPHPDVYTAICCHPDIMLHPVEDDVMVYAPNTPKKVVEKLRENGFVMVCGETSLGSKYPETIPYNVARVGRYAFHNTKYTDPILKKLLLQKDIELLHVNQGYAKCLTCIVDENSIITSDTEIYRKADAAKLDALLIEPDDAIRLETFDMGFLGGASGLIGKNRLAITGDLKFHKNWKQIMEFLSLKATDVVMLNDDRLVDLGTIIPIKQEK